MTVAALYQSLMAYLYRLRATNLRWRLYPATLIRENRWRAQRYGATGKLIDHGKTEPVPFTDLVEEIIELLTPDATALGCLGDIERARRIAAEGSSADRQRAVHAAAVEAGADPREAGVAVVDSLIAEFASG